MDKIFLDIEVSPNFMLIGYMYEDGTVKQYSAFGKKKSLKTKHIKALQELFKTHTMVTFNGMNYDSPVMSEMFKGRPCTEIYGVSVDLVEQDGNRWDYGKATTNHIDLIEVAPQTASLKLYGARINTQKLQDLPYGVHDDLTKKQAKRMAEYNINDLVLTHELYKELLPQLNLRAQMGGAYKLNVMSRSDAQIAEDIFAKRLGKTRKELNSGKKLPKSIMYEAPDTIKFKSKYFNDLVKRIEDTEIEISKGGSPMMPKWLKDEVIVINDKRYNIGLGGLHSMEKSLAVEGDLGNVDVASMYPSLIIALGMYPEHIGHDWLDIYTDIRDTRMKAKHSGDKVTSDVLKIVLNGSYGKLGSFYSFLYAPNLMLQVTFTGQLYLLMLIEAIENKGIEVISSNTDGIELVYKSKKDRKKVKKLVKKWEAQTGLDMEYGDYKGLYARDVNNYMAIYDGYVKAKGFYGEPSLSKNPQHPIVQEAIRKFLLDGTSMEKTITNCTDVAQFCVSRAVTGGALWSPKTYPDTDEYEKFIVEFDAGIRKDNKALRKRNEAYKKEFVLAEGMKHYIGKTVRFYYVINGNAMFYAKSGNTVPLSDGCKPMMELTEKIPKDLDYDKYIALANDYLKDTGYEKV